MILPEDDEVLYDENYKVLEENKMSVPSKRIGSYQCK
ncbi:MAG: hypothetical protein HW406_1182, partial [Candidatus Brocadiaceae bacterium]|nr:hypothetical protein [Candidatus Brocadiaceae bacterium]